MLEMSKENDNPLVLEALATKDQARLNICILLFEGPKLVYKMKQQGQGFNTANIDTTNTNNNKRKASYHTR